MMFTKKLTLSAALVLISSGAYASNKIECPLAQTAFGYAHKIDRIVLQTEDPGRASIRYQDGTVESLSPESGTAGPFGEIKFKPSLEEPIEKAWAYAQVTSKALGVIQTRFICYFPGSDTRCSSMSGKIATEEVVQFNFSGELLSFNGTELPLCERK